MGYPKYLQSAIDVPVHSTDAPSLKAFTSVKLLESFHMQCLVEYLL